MKYQINQDLNEIRFKAEHCKQDRYKRQKKNINRDNTKEDIRKKNSAKEKEREYIERT